MSLTVIDNRADTPGHHTLPLVADVHNNNSKNNYNDIKLLWFSEPDKNRYWRAFPLPRWLLRVYVCMLGSEKAQEKETIWGTNCKKEKTEWKRQILIEKSNRNLNLFDVHYFILHPFLVLFHYSLCYSLFFIFLSFCFQLHLLLPQTNVMTTGMSGLLLSKCTVT